MLPMASGRLRTRAVAVLGSATIDIVGYSRDRKENLDKIGDIEMKLGGSAYRSAIYLARSGYKVKFWTLLKSASLAAQWFTAKLKSERIDAQFITRKRNASIGLFLAIKHHGEHLAALTHVGLEKIDLPKSQIRRMISKSATVLSDCSLSISQISELLKLCDAARKPVTFSGVSESRVLHFVHAISATPSVSAFGLAVDALIYETIKSHLKERGVTNASEITQALRLNVLAVFEGLTKASDGSGSHAKFQFHFSDGTKKEFMQFVPGEAKTTGARDALGSALAVIASDVKDSATPSDILGSFKALGWPILLSVIRNEGQDLGEIPGGGNIESFGIETGSPRWYTVVYRTLTALFAQLAQVTIVLLTLAAAFSQAFPDRAKPMLEWVLDHIF